VTDHSFATCGIDRFERMFTPDRRLRLPMFLVPRKLDGRECDRETEIAEQGGVAQKCFGKPACLKTALAVFVLGVFVKLRRVIGLNQIS
jgi:hypothetical protein